MSTDCIGAVGTCLVVVQVKKDQIHQGVQVGYFCDGVVLKVHKPDVFVFALVKFILALVGQGAAT